MGGRGAKINLSGIPKNKRKAIAKIGRASCRERV